MLLSSCCFVADFVVVLMIRGSGQVDAEDMTTSCPGHDLSVKGVVGRRGPVRGTLWRWRYGLVCHGGTIARGVHVGDWIDWDDFFIIRGVQGLVMIS